MKTGAEHIFDERVEQIMKHHHSVEDDIKYNDDGELIYFAMALLTKKKSYYPGYWKQDIYEHAVSKSDIERLAIAGALIAAEIDRLTAIDKTTLK